MDIIAEVKRTSAKKSKRKKERLTEQKAIYFDHMCCN